MLAVGVPKAVTLYKSKIIEGIIRDLNGRLEDESLTDEQMKEIMLRLSALNEAKVGMAHKLQRLIL